MFQWLLFTPVRKLEAGMLEKDLTYADHRRIIIEINYVIQLLPKRKFKTKHVYFAPFFKSLSKDFTANKFLIF